MVKNKETLIADLDYATQLARSGENAPLVGGPIGLMWGILITLTFFIQWGVLSGTFGWPANTLMYLWIGFAVIGGLGSTLLGRKVSSKPGAHSVANRVESYVWLMFAGLGATLFIGVMLNIMFSGGSPTLFDIILITLFAGQGLAYGVVAKMTKLRILHIASFLGFTASAVSFIFYGQPEIYLIGAIATLFTVVMPSLVLLKKEEAQHDR